MQRFGSSSVATHSIGLAILRGNWKVFLSRFIYIYLYITTSHSFITHTHTQYQPQTNPPPPPTHTIQEAVDLILCPRTEASEDAKKARAYWESTHDVEGTLKILPRHLYIEKQVLRGLRVSGGGGKGGRRALVGEGV